MVSKLLSKFDSCLNEVMTKYNLWSTNTDKADNIDDECNDANRQAIENLLQTGYSSEDQ